MLTWSFTSPSLSSKVLLIPGQIILFLRISSPCHVKLHHPPRQLKDIDDGPLLTVVDIVHLVLLYINHVHNLLPPSPVPAALVLMMWFILTIFGSSAHPSMVHYLPNLSMFSLRKFSKFKMGGLHHRHDSSYIIFGRFLCSCSWTSAVLISCEQIK